MSEKVHRGLLQPSVELMGLGELGSRHRNSVIMKTELVRLVHKLCHRTMLMSAVISDGQSHLASPAIRQSR